MTAPSPVDLAPYLGDLVLVDATAQDITDLALAELAQLIPGWEPAEGAPEVALASALAVEVAQLVAAVNRLPVAILQAFLGLIGIPRDLGAPPTGLVALTSNDPGATVTIAAGTRFRLELGDGLEPVDFTLDEETEIPDGGAPVIAAMTGTRNTADANGPAYLTALTILDAAPLTSAAVVGAPAGGRGPENGPEYLERAARTLGRLTETLVMPEHFTARALELAEVHGITRAHTLTPYNADTDSFDLGHVTVAVAGPDGATVDSLARDAVRDDLAARALASLTVHVVPATVTDLDLTAEVLYADGWTPAAVDAAITSALTEYLSPDAWPWRGIVYRNALLGLIASVPGVAAIVELYDDTGTDPFVDLTLPGAANLTRLGELTITEAP